MMKIEVLYFQGCPNHKAAFERVQTVLRSDGISAEIAEVEIRDDAAAKAAGFLGSPTILVNGRDIDADARGIKDVSLACRWYPGGLPPEEMIRAALREAQGDSR